MLNPQHVPEEAHAEVDKRMVYLLPAETSRGVSGLPGPPMQVLPLVSWTYSEICQSPSQSTLTPPGRALMWTIPIALPGNAMLAKGDTYLRRHSSSDRPMLRSATQVGSAIGVISNGAIVNR